MKKTTIHDVAARAGVSLMTVSRVVNAAPNVAAETRRRVLDAVQALDFRPNRVARNLRTRRSHWIAMLSLRPPARMFAGPVSYMAELQAGVIARCRQEQYHISFDHYDAQQAQAQVEGLATQLGPDGILLIPPLSSSRPVLALLRRLALPVVRIAPADNHSDPSPRIDMDDTLAACEMTQHLLQLGHRRIAFIEGPAQHSASAARLAGFRAALRAAGIRPGARTVQQGQFTAQSGASAARALLTGVSAASRPTAIFASNDEMAAGALCVAHELGLRVPRDLSVVGFDDTYIAGMLWPALTTVRQPIHDMGFSATHQLLGLIRTGQATQRTTLSHSIVIRDSAAAPPR